MTSEADFYANRQSTLNTNIDSFFKKSQDALRRSRKTFSMTDDEKQDLRIDIEKAFYRSHVIVKAASVVAGEDGYRPLSSEQLCKFTEITHDLFMAYQKATGFGMECANPYRDH